MGEVTREVCDLDDDMLISGMVVDPELGDKVQVTLVATGLWGKAFQAEGLEEAGTEQSPRDEQSQDPQRPGRRPSVQGGVALDRAKAKKAGNEGPPNLDYLDIPAFLRWNVD